jgi:hypothetical protein
MLYVLVASVAIYLLSLYNNMLGWISSFLFFLVSWFILNKKEKIYINEILKKAIKKFAKNDQ